MPDKERKESLTVVIPVYNETPLLGRSFERIRRFIARSPGISVDVLFIDDGSTDGSADALRRMIERARAPGMRILRHTRNRGKGSAVRSGVEAAGGRYVLMSDADLSTPLEDWLRLKAALDAGADIACGSRALPGSEIGIPRPLHRRILSRVFNALARLAGVRGFHDTQCGFKLFRRDTGRRVFATLRTRRFAFDVELIASARAMGLRVEEVPVRWDYSGHTTVNVLSSGAQMLWDLFLLALRRPGKKNRPETTPPSHPQTTPPQGTSK